MDIYIIICFFAVFAALVEFACINFIDTFIKRFKAWEEEEKKRLEKEAKKAKAAAEAAKALEEAKIPPEEMFQKETGKYSAWDDKGVPTHLADGKEVPKVQKCLSINFLTLSFDLKSLQLFIACSFLRPNKRSCKSCGLLKRRNTTTT